MKTWMTRTAAASAVVIGLGVGVAAVASASPTPTPSPTTSAPATVRVDAAVAAQLRYLREEERLARDVYTAIAARYSDDAPQFARIAAAEQRHFDAMGVMLARYGILDPSAGRASGSYADPALSALHAKLMAQAKLSLAEAYKVGVAIEKADLADLKTALAQNNPNDVKAVYTNLQNGSNAHLAAFTALRDGKAVGVGTGYGRGPGGANAAAASSPGTNAHNGQGRRSPANGAGTGVARNANADCPLR